MTAVQMEVLGARELASKLVRLSEEMAGGFLATAALSGGLLVQNEAKRRAPKRAGTLSRSIHTEITSQSVQQATVTVGTDLEYAAIQEFGGTIRPRRAKALAIPLTDRARAVPPRQFPGLHVQGRAGRGVLADASGVPQYALRQSVTIPAHPYLIPALTSQQGAVVREVESSLRALLTRVVG